MNLSKHQKYCSVESSNKRGDPQTHEETFRKISETICDAVSRRQMRLENFKNEHFL